jgi:nitrogen fixation-related uncharacterized protein
VIWSAIMSRSSCSSAWGYGVENGQFQDEQVPDDAIRMDNEIWIALPGDKS